MIRPTASLHTLRTAIAAVIALDVLVLLVLSVTKDTVTRTTSQPLPRVAAVPTGIAGTSSAPPFSTAPPAPVAAIPVAAPIAGSNDAQPSPAAKPSSPPNGKQSSKPTPPSGSPTAPASAASCPITITKQPPPAGGLQSLIGFAPAFGQFSAEAFAAASAYQPVLQLLGPILAQYPQLAPKIAPLVNPLVSALQAGSNTLFALLDPIYSPYRQRVLQAETKLAAALAPYSEKLAASPLGGCLVELETTLVADAH